MGRPDAVEGAFVLSDHAAGAIAYLTFIPAILFLLLEPYKQNSYVRYHSWQSILLSLGAFAVNVVLAFLLVFALLFTPRLHLFTWRAIELFWMAVWIACVVNAAMGKRFKLPVIGELAEQQAKK
ncbi:MAG: Tic20 family protein [Terracidiphilus sp.]